MDGLLLSTPQNYTVAARQAHPGIHGNEVAWRLTTGDGR
jgi:hypothetical protein